MKKKITILSVIALICFIISSAFTGKERRMLYSYNTSLKPVSAIGDSGFINCIFNAHIDVDYPAMDIGLWLNEISDSLKFNTVQMYGEWGSERYGWFSDSLSPTQITNVNKLMDSIHEEDLNGLYGRVKIEKLCYGQRLIYEVSQNTGNTTTNDGFCYSIIPDSVSSWIANDSGRTVRYCDPDTNKAGYICDSIYENFHHNDLYNFNEADMDEWSMKPMMRIDTADFDPQSTTPVVAIIAKSFDGSTLDSIIIRVKNFGYQNNYNGKYIEKYYLTNITPLFLTVSGNDTNGLGKGIKNVTYQVPYWNWNDSDFVDFEVYWFGQVKVWFDKMTVDDFWGNKLFNGELDARIEDEVSNFTSHSSNLAFFADEITCANIPCIKYVKDKMIEYDQSAKLTISTTNYLNVRSMRNDTLAHRKFLQTVQPYMLATDIHEIREELPNTLPPPYTGAGVEMVTPQQYNTALQQKLGHKNGVWLDTEHPKRQGSFVYQVNLARSQRDMYSPNSILIVQPQIHGWLYREQGGVAIIGGMREPLNEEIQVQAMVAIAHGADGISWFIFQSWGDSALTMPIIEPFFDEMETDEIKLAAGYGLLTPPESSPTPRYSNMFGQNKWKYVGEMNTKIETWKYYLDRIDWKSGYSVHNDGSNQEYIHAIMSRDPDKSDPNSSCVHDSSDYLPYGYYDCSDETYWEMGFFEPIATSLTDNSKYFIMVNRRCIPYDETDTTIGDDRQLYVLFKSELPGDFTNWNIIDLENDSIIAKIVKGSNQYYDFGEFDPGEGRLYKIVPVL